MDARSFWNHVRIGDGCWEWTGGRGHFGYGSCRFEGRMMGAHRVAWHIYYGDPGNLCVLHHCDNPGCVRPDHLFLGTKGDNNRDRATKGRTANANKTHCKRGHLYDEANTYIDRLGRRICRACQAMHARQLRSRA